jgi:hypothetical protein
MPPIIQLFSVLLDKMIDKSNCNDYIQRRFPESLRQWRSPQGEIAQGFNTVPQASRPVDSRNGFFYGHFHSVKYGD